MAVQMPKKIKRMSPATEEKLKKKRALTLLQREQQQALLQQQEGGAAGGAAAKPASTVVFNPNRFKPKPLPYVIKKLVNPADWKPDTTDSRPFFELCENIKFVLDFEGEVDKDRVMVLL